MKGQGKEGRQREDGEQAGCGHSAWGVASGSEGKESAPRRPCLQHLGETTDGALSCVSTG